MARPITVKQLETLSDNDVNRRLFDGDGLYGRVRKQKSGIVVTFEYRYKLRGKARTFACGKWPDSKLSVIRAVRHKQAELVAAGLDPIEERKKEKLTKQAATAAEIEKYQQEMHLAATGEALQRTFGTAVEKWAATSLPRRKNGSTETLRAFRKDILPTLSGVPLTDVTRSMLMDKLDNVVQRGALVMANRLFSDLRQFFNFAVTRQWITESPLAGVKKADVGGPEKERQRFLSNDEIKELQTRIASSRIPERTEIAIWLMLSTCCRVSELSKAQWKDIDIANAEWHLPDTKNGATHTIYLSDFSKVKLSQLKELTGAQEWCFPARKGDTHINEKSISKQIRDRVRDVPLANRSKASASLLLTGGAWSAHDLRRTGATIMASLRVSSDTIDRCLNHREQSRLKRIYQRHDYKEEQQEAWDQLGKQLSLLTSHETGTEPA